MNKLCAMKNVIECLEIFLLEPKEMALSELAHMMNLTKTELLPIVKVLESKGYMTFDEIHSSLRPGQKINPGAFLFHQGTQKGVNETTLMKVRDKIREIPPELDFSSSEFASLSGISRVTARRYLEFLVLNGILCKGNQHGEVGRPINTYRVVAAK